MKKLTLTVLAVGFAAALQPFANAQFGSGIVFDPTQSGGGVPSDQNASAHAAYNRAIGACLEGRGYSVK